MSENFLIRDVFNTRNVSELSSNIQKHFPSFDTKRFHSGIDPLLGDATFSERKKAITDLLLELLPEDINQCADVLVNACPPPYSGEGLDGDMDRFIVAPMADVISIRGIDHFEPSMKALHTLTQAFSAEWAIRPFIEKYPDESLKMLKEWTGDPNPHVRRLVSEGSRPYLPWGKKLTVTDLDPKWSLALLGRLKNDSSDYVLTSVANHLNDLTKKHADVVLNALDEWKDQINTHPVIPFYKKALRTIIKNGNIKALELIGFSGSVQVEINKLKCNSPVEMGKRLSFSFEVVSMDDEPQDILIDFIIHFKKSNGTNAPKVFKLTTFTLPANELRTINKSFSFKPITTRKYYPGTHHLEIMVNGKVRKRQSFEVKIPV